MPPKPRKCPALAGLPVALAVLLAASLLGATPALAAPAWLAPENLSVPSPNTEDPDVAVDAQGDAVAVWRRFDGTTGIVQSASRPAGGSWSAPVNLSAANAFLNNVEVAGDRRGDAVAIWSSEHRVQSASRPAGGTWSPPAEVSEGIVPDVTMGPSGEAVAVWVGPGEVAETATLPARGTWSAPQSISAASLEVDDPEVAIDLRGDAVAVWSRREGSEATESATRLAGGAWSAPERISTAGQDTYTPDVAVDRQGGAIAVWYRQDGAQQIVQSASRPAGGTWSAPQNISAASAAVGVPRLAADAQGDAVAVWDRKDALGEWTTQVSSRPVAGTWSAPANLSVPGQGTQPVQIAMDPGGDAAVVWSRDDGGTGIIAQSATRPAGGAWSPPANLSAPGHSADQPQVAVDAQGDAVAVWAGYDAVNWTVQAAAYDAAGPQLHALSIPAAGTAGVPVLFSVSPFDAFSSLGATSWSLGDGATASGTVVSHAYTAPGTYAVGVTAADAFGNPSTASGTITIAPAPLGGPGRVTTATGTAIAARLVRVKKGRALLRLRCPGAGSCRGTAKLTSPKKSARHHGSGGHRARRALAGRGRRGGPIQLGAARFAIGAGGHKTVAVKLGRRAKKLLRRSGRRGLKARVAGTGIKHGAVLLKPADRKGRGRR